MQQCDENHCVYLARIGRHSKKAGGNVVTFVQHRIIYSCVITASKLIGNVRPCVLCHSVNTHDTMSRGISVKLGTCEWPLPKRFSGAEVRGEGHSEVEKILRV